MVETSSRVPSRPPALSWHTHSESANQTLALDICECQRGTERWLTSFRTRPRIKPIHADSGFIRGFVRKNATGMAHATGSESSRHQRQTRSTIATMAPLPRREITIVALFGPSNLSCLRSSDGSMSTPRFLISSTPISA